MQEKVSITPIPGEGQGAAFWRPYWAPRGSAQSIPEWARWWRRREEAGKKGQSVRLALGKGREWGSPAKDVLSRRFQLESRPLLHGADTSQRLLLPARSGSSRCCAQTSDGGVCPGRASAGTGRLWNPALAAGREASEGSVLRHSL